MQRQRPSTFKVGIDLDCHAVHLTCPLSAENGTLLGLLFHLADKASKGKEVQVGSYIKVS